eukprot:3633941-Rhodomonas_salina.5
MAVRTLRSQYWSERLLGERKRGLKFRTAYSGSAQREINHARRHSWGSRTRSAMVSCVRHEMPLTVPVWSAYMRVCASAQTPYAAASSTAEHTHTRTNAVHTRDGCDQYKAENRDQYKNETKRVT